MKSRDSDHLQNLVYDLKISISDQEIEKYLETCEKLDKQPIPKYAHDVHTKAGKMAGKTKKMFFLEENSSLFPQDNDPIFDAQLKEYIEFI
jgi:hypothetical protein